MMWALTEMAPTLLQLARLEEAVERVREAESLVAWADPLAVLRYHCSAALVFQRSGAHARVLTHARQALDMVRQRPLVVWSDITSLSALVEACLELWEEAHRTAGPEAAAEPRALSDAALRVLRKASRLYPVALGRTERLEGIRAWLEGRLERARSKWHRALHLARTHRMPTDEGLAHYELARRAPEPEARASHLAQARRIFERLGATGSLRALDALESPPSAQPDAAL
jgi:hypothetical protein